MKNNSDINIIDKKNRLEKAVAYLKGAQIIKNQKDISDTGIVSGESLTRALKGNEKYLTDNFLKKIAAKYVLILIGSSQAMALCSSHR